MSNSASEVQEPVYFQIKDPPYENHFFADDVVSCQVVLASPLPRAQDDGFHYHRLLFSWPAGNSGAAVFFKTPVSEDATNAIKLIPGSNGRILKSAVEEPEEPDPTSGSEHPNISIQGKLSISTTAVLDLAILGSVRTLRDYTEGDGILNPHVMGSTSFDYEDDGFVAIGRTWFDGTTTTLWKFFDGSGSMKLVKRDSGSEVRFTPGTYSFDAGLNYPQTPSVPPTRLLKPAYHHLISQQVDAVNALSFLCTSEKILAGGWRFFTYFGRDSMISLLLLMPILRNGEQGAVEVGLRAVLERVDGQDGSVCHEENLGDYPAAQEALHGGSNGEAEYDYKMVDTDFFLPILMKEYFIRSEISQERLRTFLSTKATLIPLNRGMTYGQLLHRTCQKIMDQAEPFAKAGGDRTYRNLIALKEGVPVGQWRDSNDGLGGGRYPYDVNTALMPAALRAIAELARAGAWDMHHGWDVKADEYADIWETSTLDFFICKILREDAKQRVETYCRNAAFPGPSRSDEINEDVYLHAVALIEDGSPVEIMHTDACFRLLLLPHLMHTTNLTSMAKHLDALDAIATSILRIFPAGLYTPVGVLVANPAYSTDATHAASFTTGAYHGTVVWSWNSLVMLTRGLEVQLSAASKTTPDPPTATPADPAHYDSVVAKMKRAYAKLWDTIEANRKHLSEEMWSWRWNDERGGRDDDGIAGGFEYVPLSHLPSPDGRGQTEGNAVQLWSLAFLALERRRELEV